MEMSMMQIMQFFNGVLRKVPSYIERNSSRVAPQNYSVCCMKAPAIREYEEMKRNEYTNLIRTTQETEKL